MLSYLLSIDSQITQFIKNIFPHNNFFDLFFSFFSQQGSSIVIWLIIIGLIIVFEGKQHHNFIIYFVIAFLSAYVVSDLLMKNMIVRPRPIPDFFSCPSNHSFPSTHAATAFAAAAILSYFHKKRKYYFYLVAFLISLSRVYLSCHYVLDIVTGGLMGYLIAKIILKMKSLIVIKKSSLK